MPPMRALPYPFLGTSTTLAPSPRAMRCDPSVLPLSATMISAEKPPFSAAAFAWPTHLASVSASLRQGITIDTSTAVGGAGSVRLGVRWATDTALETNDWHMDQLALK